MTAQLHEPFRTIAVICVCFGLRISEALALKWCDVDWLNARLSVERGIVRQIVDDVKTVNSERALHIDGETLEIFKAWKQASEFSAPGDWIFASPVQLGRLPFSSTGVLHVFQKAAKRAGIGVIGTHTRATHSGHGLTPWERRSRPTEKQMSARGHPHHNEHLSGTW